MSTTTVDIETPDGVADAYLTQPDDGQPHPGVLFVMDIVGLRPRIEEMAERIAQRGYVVLAPNFFYRAGRASELPKPDPADPAGRANFWERVRGLAGQLTPEALERDGGAYLDYLQRVAPGPVAITGYCMGARVGLRIAAAHPDRVAAVAGFHGGGLVSEEADSPHLAVGKLKAEVYFGHADQDQSNTAEQIAALDRALDEAGIRHRSELYEGARHGYTMSDSAAYDEAASERHFDELFALLERTLPVAASA